MKVIAAALVAATFVLTNAVLAHAAPISTTRSNIKRPGVAVGDLNGDGIAGSRSEKGKRPNARNRGQAKESGTIFDRWGKTK
jgi:hypothetical protein